MIRYTIMRDNLKKFNFEPAEIAVQNNEAHDNKGSLIKLIAELLRDDLKSSSDTAA